MKTGERRRGFNAFRKTVRDNPSRARLIADCKSCRFLNHNDECTNPSVTEFDMVIEGSKVYCTFWQGYEYDNGRKKKDDIW